MSVFKTTTIEWGLLAQGVDPESAIALATVLGVVIVIGLGAFAWAAFFRKSKKRRKRIKRPHTWQLDQEPDADHPHRHRKRHSSKRPDEVILNPTLAQTGELPPRREEGHISKPDDGGHSTPTP